ncbi:MAG: SDR family oxidoreductase [Pseudomonadota bacterium]
MALKSILITGGGSGIGAAFALDMARRNCRVIITGRRADALASVAAQSPNILALPGDVTDAHDQTTWAAALADLPGPRAVFHGAGYFQLGPLASLTAGDWLRSFDTNVTARWALSVKCAPHLTEGRMLFVGSDSGRNVRAGAAAYSIAQAASETLRRALQVEWQDRGIAVTGFKPGLVDTDLVRGFLATSEAEFPARAAFQAYIDRGEVATPETIATFAAWLLMDVPADRFQATDWDIRDTDHHAEWLNGALYTSK